MSSVRISLGGAYAILKIASVSSPSDAPDVNDNNSRQPSLHVFLIRNAVRREANRRHRNKIPSFLVQAAAAAVMPASNGRGASVEPRSCTVYNTTAAVMKQQITISAYCEAPCPNKKGVAARMQPAV